MTKKEIIDYIMNTPYNTNPTLVKNKLDIWAKQMINRNDTLEFYKDYLGELTYNDWNYSLINENVKIIPGGGCSAVVKDGIIGRNYDWYYDDTIEFAVRCLSNDGRRHDSIGMAAIAGINNKLVEKTSDFLDFVINDLFDYLPFSTLDGINDAGVYCSSNVVPLDYGKTKGTNPKGKNLNQACIVRYVLDYADSVDDAIEKLSKLNIYSHKDFDNEIHTLIVDKDKAVVVEFINNEMKVIDEFVDDKVILTNFHLYGWDGTDETLELHPAGVERYNILADGYDDINDEDDMLALMKQVWYTKLYDRTTEPYWYSEFNGYTPYFGELNKYSQPEDYEGIIEYAISQYDPDDRNGKAWQTLHTNLYNIESSGFEVVIQEDDSESYSFNIDDR